MEGLASRLCVVLWASVVLSGCYASHEACAAGEPCDCRAALPIPSGPGWMGAAGMFDWPLHELVLTSEAWLGTYEITAGCYRRCVAEGGCVDPSDYLDFESPADPVPGLAVLTPDYFEDPQNADLPMIPLHRRAAVEYCEWLGGRLPTNGEWERAARGVEGRGAPWLPIPEDPANPGWRVDHPEHCAVVHLPNSVTDVSRCWHVHYLILPVGTFPPGVYGHYDLMGAPYEWVSDWYGPYPEGTVVDYTGPSAAEAEYVGIMRGGLDAWHRIRMRPDADLVGTIWPYITLRTARCAFDERPAPML